MNTMNAIVPTTVEPITGSSGITPSDGMAHTVEIDTGVLRQLGWTGIWYDLQERIRQELDRSRKVRPLLPLWTDPNLDPEAIPDYTIQNASKSDTHDADSPRGGPFLIPLRARVVSVLISSEFKVSTAQLGDAGVALHLVSESARRVGQAEDSVLLYGKFLDDAAVARESYDGVVVQPPPEWKSTSLRSWQELHIHAENLPQQDRFLFHYESASEREKNPEAFLPPFRKHGGPDSLAALWCRVVTNYGVPALGGGSTPSSKDILEVLLAGIAKLQNDGHYGEYCAVVAPDLYQAAFAPRSSPGTAWDDKREAPIYQIRPVLREGGFTYSRMLMPGTGVLFSLGGGALTLAVPREAHVQFVSMDRDITLSVQERIRLLINRPEAVVPLGTEYPT